MTRSKALPGLALLAGVALHGCADPGAITTLSDVNTMGRARAARPVSQLRLGYGLDVAGKVPPSFAAKRFMSGDPIHLSMEVGDAPFVSSVRVTVRDLVTDATVWSEVKDAPPGESYVSFEVGRGLAHGSYRADVILADAVVGQREFQVRGRGE